MKKKDYISREVSWLSFNERVLQEAADKSVPLVERLRFLGIFSNNLDEFFRVRVATQLRLLNFGKGIKQYMPEKPKKILEKIQRIVQNLQVRFDEIFNEIVQELKEKGVFLINETQLCDEHATYIRQYFKRRIADAIAPMMISKIDKFPELHDRTIYLAVKLSKKLVPEAHEYSLMEIPTADCPRFIELPAIGDNKYIILLDDAIRFCLNMVFSNLPYDTYEAYTIKITRDAELDVDNDIAESLLEKISKGVSNRKKGQPVRFVYDATIAPDLLQFIAGKLDLDEDDNIMPGGRYHNFKDFMGFPNPGGPDLINEPMTSAPIPFLENAPSILEVIKKKDFSLHYPYQSFSYYVQMLREAAIDPQVTSIKITLYRVATESKVVRALMNAAQNGKSVTAVVELLARFDEGANIFWSKKMEESGVKVIFGVSGLKVHSKQTLITRMENGVPVSYATLSTGNFHEGNANVYTDFNVFTADKRLTSEVDKVFTFLEYNFKAFSYKHLLVAPYNMRRKLYWLIENEIRNAKKKLPAYIYCKINNIVDYEVIRKLYQASNAGVTIKLMVRGICSLVPGIPGQSENIQVVSVADRLLEHSRFFIFCNNNHEKYYITSADWMTRNLDYRVEVASPVYDHDIQKELKEIFEAGFRDNVKARIVNAKQDNTYKKESKKKPYRSQTELHAFYKTKHSKVKEN